MIHKSKIAEVIRKGGKRPSKAAIAEIDRILRERAEEIVENAVRKANFAGRKTILAEDVG